MHQPIDFTLWGSWNYQDYLTSDWWRVRSAIAKEKAGYRCEKCGVTFGLHIHHLRYDNLGHEEDADLICLCHECHKKIHGKQYMGRENEYSNR